MIIIIKIKNSNRQKAFLVVQNFWWCDKNNFKKLSIWHEMPNVYYIIYVYDTTSMSLLGILRLSIYSSS